MGNCTTMVFPSVKKPHKPVTRSTLTKWVLRMLDLSGVDIKMLKAHSLRAAVTSKVSNLGLQLKDILENGNWTQESTWQKFYHKRVRSASQRLQETLLSEKTTNMALKEDLPN